MHHQLHMHMREFSLAKTFADSYKRKPYFMYRDEMMDHQARTKTRSLVYQLKNEEYSITENCQNTKDCPNTEECPNTENCPNTEDRANTEDCLTNENCLKPKSVLRSKNVLKQKRSDVAPRKNETTNDENGSNPA